MKFELDTLREGFRRAAETQVSRYFHSRSISVVGLRGLRVQGFSAAFNGARGSAQIEAPEALVLVDLLDLLYGTVNIERIQLDGAVVRVAAAQAPAAGSVAPKRALAGLAPGAFRVTGKDCRVELSGFLPNRGEPLAFDGVSFEAFRLADSPDYRVALAATLRGPQDIAFSATGRYAAPDDFDLRADSPRIATEAVNALLPSPQAYVLAGAAGPSVRAEARPGQPVAVSLEASLDGLVVKGQPEGLAPQSGRVEAQLRYDRDARRLEVVDLHVDAPAVRARFDGALDLSGETPGLALAGEATRIPVDLLLERARSDERLKPLGKVELALAEPYRVEVNVSGTARQPAVSARFTGAGGTLAFAPAKPKWPEGSLDVGLVDIAWDSASRRPTGTLNVVGGTIRHAESKVSAEDLTGTVRIEGNTLHAYPLQATVTGNTCAARIDYDLETQSGECTVAGALSNIEKTKLGTAIENTRVYGTAAVRAKAVKKGQKYTVDADLDATDTGVAYRWYYDKTPGIGGGGKFHIEFVPRKSMQIDGDLVLASSPLQASLAFAYDGAKYRLQTLRADTDRLDISGVGSCLRIPYKISGGVGTDGHYRWTRRNVKDRTWEATASFTVDELFAEAIGKDALMRIKGADVSIDLDKDADPSGSLVLTAEEAYMPPLRQDWFVPIRPDPSEYPDFKPDFETWDYRLSAKHLELPPWKGTDFTGEAYSNPARSGLRRYSAEIDGGRIGGTYERNRPDNAYVTTIDWTGVPAHYFLEHLKLSQLLSGPTSGQITYSLDRDDPGTLNGTGHFEVENGKFSEEFLYSKLQGQANAEGVTFPSLRFQRLKSDIAFKRDVVRTPNADLQSEGIHIQGGGQFVIGGDMDYDFKVAISPDTAMQIPMLQQSFNIEGHRLAQKDIELAFKVTGPTGGPRGQLAQAPPARVTLVSGALEMTSDAIKVIDIPRKILVDLLKLGGGLVGATK